MKKLLSTGVRIFFKLLFLQKLEVPAIDNETTSCPLQNALQLFPSGCLVIACCKIFNPFDSAADILRSLTTNFPLSFSLEMKIQSIKIREMGLDRSDD